MNAAPPYPLASQIGTPRSGLGVMRDAVYAYFEERSIPAVVAEVGLKYRSFIINQAALGGGNRVVFIPGEFDGSSEPKPRAYGSLSRDTRNHSSVSNPRELLAWDRPVTLSVWAAPETMAYNESANVLAAENLLEQVARAVHTACLADIEWGKVVINTAPENTFGVEFLVSLIQHGPLFDVTREYVQPSASVPRQ